MNVLRAVRRNRLTSDSYIGESALRQVFQGGFNVMMLGGKEEALGDRGAGWANGGSHVANTSAHASLRWGKCSR